MAKKKATKTEEVKETEVKEAGQDATLLVNQHSRISYGEGCKVNAGNYQSRDFHASYSMDVTEGQTPEEAFNIAKEIVKDELDREESRFRATLADAATQKDEARAKANLQEPADDTPDALLARLRIGFKQLEVKDESAAQKMAALLNDKANHTVPKLLTYIGALADKGIAI